MAPSAKTISSAPLPLDGSSLATAAPPVDGSSRLTFTGVVRFEYAGLELDAAHADEPGSLIRIEPGQWHLVDARPELHQYTFAPSAPLGTSATVRLDVDNLVDRFIISPKEVRKHLSGTLTVDLVSLPVAAAAPAGPGVVGVAAVGLAVLLGVAAAALKLRAWRALDADLRRELTRIHACARALKKAARGRTDLGPHAHERVPPLVRSADRLGAAVKELRHRLRKAGSERIFREAQRLEHTEDQTGQGSEELAELGRQTALLEPLLAEEKELTARIERIRAALETLRVAWLTHDAPDPHEGSRKADELLGAVENEIKATVATRHELRQL